MDKVEREIDNVGSSTVVSDLTAPIADHPVASVSTAGALLTLAAIHRDFAWQRRSLATIRRDQGNVSFGNHFAGSEIPGIADNFRSTLAGKQPELHPALRHRARVDAHEGTSLANTYRRAAGAFTGPL